MPTPMPVSAPAGSSAHLSTLADVAREVIAQTSSLVAARECPCGHEETWLCESCAARLAQPALRVESCCEALQDLSAARVHELGPQLPAGVDHTAVLPVLALGEYAGDLQRLILAWKNGGMLHLGRRIAPSLSPAVAQLGREGGVRRPALVPVSSRLAARLRRGEDHTAELVRELGRIGAGRPLLLRSTPTTTQEGLTARQRRSRRVRLARTASRHAGAGPVVIVDDVVTTGSTLRGMHAALSEAGFEVLGAVVVASARIPRPPSLP